MSLERVTLHHEQETMLMTLYLHARDARSDRPVLDDRYAEQMVDRIDYDFDRLSSIAGNQPVIVSRAKAIDEIVRSFLGKHEDAVVLHLGCGLDTRVQRIAPGSAVTWFDIDQPPVIELRRRLVDDRPGTTMLATSVVDKGWWTAVPEERPTLIVGEGLVMYLAPRDVHALLGAALSRRVPAQTLVFDTVAPWVRAASRWQQNFRTADTRFLSTTTDLGDAVERHGQLQLVEEQSLVSLARRATPGALGAFVAAIDAIPAGHRAMVLRTYRQSGSSARSD